MDEEIRIRVVVRELIVVDPAMELHLLAPSLVCHLML
jgi:hypothetical protein